MFEIIFKYLLSVVTNSYLIYFELQLTLRFMKSLKSNANMKLPCNLHGTFIYINGTFILVSLE